MALKCTGMCNILAVPRYSHTLYTELLLLLHAVAVPSLKTPSVHAHVFKCTEGTAHIWV